MWPIDQLAAGSASSAPSGPADAPSQPGAEESPRASTTTDHEPRERVRLAGRLGADPYFRETKTGVLIGAFPLGVKQEDGSTTWEQVVVFRDRAETGPRKGSPVDVIGYRHVREQPNKDGVVKPIAEIYAVVVKTRELKSPPKA